MHRDASELHEELDFGAEAPLQMGSNSSASMPQQQELDFTCCAFGGSFLGLGP